MFLSKVPAWKTRVEYGKILAIEHGEVVPEKFAAFGQIERVDEAPAARAAAPEKAAPLGALLAGERLGDGWQ